MQIEAYDITVQYNNTIQYNTVQYNTVQYSTVELVLYAETDKNIQNVYSYHLCEKPLMEGFFVNSG